MQEMFVRRQRIGEAMPPCRIVIGWPIKKLPHRGVEPLLEHVLAEAVDQRGRREDEGTQSSLSNVLGHIA